MSKYKFEFGTTDQLAETIKSKRPALDDAETWPVPTPEEYRELYGIYSVEDCSCASEEVAAGYVEAGLSAFQLKFKL